MERLHLLVRGGGEREVQGRGLVLGLEDAERGLAAVAHLQAQRVLREDGDTQRRERLQVERLAGGVVA